MRRIEAFPHLKRPRVEMVPLIDTFFLLLTFFIFGVFSMTMQQGILVDLPSAETAASSQEETVTISVAADGAVFLNQDAVTLEALAGRLGAHRGESGRDPFVVINADEQARHGVVIAVLDTVRRVGLPRVSFQTVSEERP